MALREEEFTDQHQSIDATFLQGWPESHLLSTQSVSKGLQEDVTMLVDDVSPEKPAAKEPVVPRRSPLAEAAQRPGDQIKPGHKVVPANGLPEPGRLHAGQRRPEEPDLLQGAANRVKARDLRKGVLYRAGVT